MKELARKVRHRHVVAVGNRDADRARGGEVLQSGGAETARADHEKAGGGDSVAALFADLRKEGLTTQSFNEFGMHRVSRPTEKKKGRTGLNAARPVG